MHSVQQGPASKSYGLQVGQLAGVPPAVIQSAKRKLAELETERVSTVPHAQQPAGPTGPTDAKDNQTALSRDADSPFQADMFISPVNDKVLSLLSDLSPDDLTPRQALEALYQLKEAAQ
jgi:DNA mismatch repair protein MutS